MRKPQAKSAKPAKPPKIKLVDRLFGAGLQRTVAATQQIVLDANWRWGYSKKMVERFLEIENAIAVLPGHSLVGAVDRALLKEYVDLMTDVNNQLFSLEGEKYVTLPLVCFKTRIFSTSP